MASPWPCTGMQGAQQQGVRNSQPKAGSSRLQVPVEATGALQHARPGGQSGGAQSAPVPEHQGVLQSSQENVDGSQTPSDAG